MCDFIIRIVRKCFFILLYAPVILLFHEVSIANPLVKPFEVDVVFLSQFPRLDECIPIAVVKLNKAYAID